MFHFVALCVSPFFSCSSVFALLVVLLFVSFALVLALTFSFVSPSHTHAHQSTTDAAPSSQQYLSRPTSTFVDPGVKAETLKRNLNRFSPFVKSGAEAFLIGAVKDVTIDPAQMLHIVVSVLVRVRLPVNVFVSLCVCLSLRCACFLCRFPCLSVSVWK